MIILQFRLLLRNRLSKNDILEAHNLRDNLWIHPHIFAINNTMLVACDHNGIIKDPLSGPWSGLVRRQVVLNKYMMNLLVNYRGFFLHRFRSCTENWISSNGGPRTLQLRKYHVEISFSSNKHNTFLVNLPVKPSYYPFLEYISKFQG